MSLCAVVLRFPFTGTKGPSPNHENSPRPLILLHQTLQLALCIRAGSNLLESAKPRFVCWTARWWNVIQHSRKCISTATESNGGELYTTPADTWHCALCNLRLVCGCLAMETYFMLLCWHCFQRYWVLQQTIFTSYALQSRSVSLWPTPSAEALLLLDICTFTKTSLTVDWGSSSRAYIWRTDLLERWHPMTVPLWRPFYCQWLFMGIAWLCAQFYTQLKSGVYIHLSFSQFLTFNPSKTSLS